MMIDDGDELLTARGSPRGGRALLSHLHFCCSCSYCCSCCGRRALARVHADHISHTLRGQIREDRRSVFRADAQVILVSE